MTTSWRFFAVRARTPSGFKWQWQKKVSAAAVTSPPFDFYFDCVSNARDNGYAGPLPSGPKAPLERLPTLPIDMQRHLLAAPLEGPSGAIALTVTAVPAVETKQRRLRASSRVT